MYVWSLVPTLAATHLLPSRECHPDGPRVAPVPCGLCSGCQAVDQAQGLCSPQGSQFYLLRLVPPPHLLRRGSCRHCRLPCGGLPSAGAASPPLVLSQSPCVFKVEGQFTRLIVVMSQHTLHHHVAHLELTTWCVHYKINGPAGFHLSFSLSETTWHLLHRPAALDSNAPGAGSRQGPFRRLSF